MLDDNGKEITAGSEIAWMDKSGSRHIEIAKADPKWEGGLKIGGRSVKSIWEEAQWIRVVS